jgi:hypothetical protein
MRIIRNHHLMLSSSSLLLLSLLWLLYLNSSTLTVEAAAFIFRNDLLLADNNGSKATRRRGGGPTTRITAAWGDRDTGSSGGAGGEALFTQVISDVDDTIKSSGGVEIAGVALGGIDVQYARGDFYPGVFEFMLQMSLSGSGCSGGSGSDSSSSSTTTTTTATTIAPTPPKVAILTARAEEFKLALELKDDSKLAVAFRQAGTAAGIGDAWGLGPVLYGSVAEWIAQSRKGLRKFANFERLLQQDPTGTILQYVYIGDTGELDQEAGETMLREYPELVKAVFLHCVSSDRIPVQVQVQHQANHGTGAAIVAQQQQYVNIVDIPAPKLINGRPIIFFRTYVGAAVAAVQLGFMTLLGLQKVMDAAVQALEQANVPRTSDKWLDLQRDLDRANALLELRQ